MASVLNRWHELTCRDLSLVRVQQLHFEQPIRLTLQPEAVVFMQHHVDVGMVDSVSKGHRAAALILVHVKELAGKGVLHEPLEGLHHLGYQLVQCEEHIAVCACISIITIKARSSISWVHAMTVFAFQADLF